MPARLLVLDDDETFATMVADTLAAAHYEVEMTTEPEKALDALHLESFDLVITDYIMPVMDGAEFMRKARESNPELPIIMISGLMGKEDLVKVANMGVTLVLEKPFKPKKLLAHVRELVQEEEAEGYAGMIKTPPASEKMREPQIDGCVRPYPKPLRYLSDMSRASRNFIQALWERSGESNLVFLAAPDGTEFELAAKEISVWKGCGDAPIHSAPASLFIAEGATSQYELLCGNAEGGGITVIKGLGAALEKDGDRTMTLISAMAETVEQNKHTAIVCVARHARELSDMTDSPIVEIPPLCERLPDLANYARIILSRAGEIELPMKQRRLEPEAIGLLLNYDWPGNYDELAAVLSHALTASKGGAIAITELREAIETIGGAADRQSIAMSAYLHGRQTSYFRRLQQEAEDPGEIFATAGIRAESIPKEVSFDESGMLYPELLKPEQ